MLQTLVGRGWDALPLTGLGLWVGAGSSLALFYYGLSRIDLILLVVGVVGLGLLALCAVFTGATALVLWRRLRGRVEEAPLLAECGYPVRTGFSMGTPWFVPFVRVGWAWDEPLVRLRQVRHGLRLHEEIIPLRRALRSDIARRFEVSDSFGLARVRFRSREERPLRFAPSVGALKQMHVIRSMAAGEDLSHPDGPPRGDRMDMRRYVPGDPIRYILWKVFARSRELVVRTPERAIGPVHQTVGYLVAADGDEPAAGAARVAVECGALGGDWVLGADGCDEHVTSRAEALDLLARSAESAQAQSGAGLSAFLGEATPGGPGHVIVFVPARPGPWLDRVVAAIARRGPASVEVLVCTDGVEEGSAPKGWWRRAAYRSAERSGSPLGVPPARALELSAVCKALAATGARVIVLDRVRGRACSAAHQRRLDARPMEAA